MVLATGDPKDTQQIQPYDIAYSSTFAGAIIKGEFVRNWKDIVQEVLNSGFTFNPTLKP
ncbi:hypothetical protein [Halobacillus sp. B29]|uniref:hypothetical protein n=1 Tax=Halobacillus sp. B29 TaxID=3457432 RepID=UPI003FCDDEDC